MHVVDYGTVATIGGLRISPGDLLHGDRHGLVSVPRPVAAAARRLREAELRVLALCHSPEFTVDGLRRLLRASPRS